MASASRWCPLLTFLLLPLMATSVDVYATEGKSASLECNGPEKTAAEFLYWNIVFETTATKGIDTTEFLYKGQKTETAEVLDNGWTLYIESVTPDFYGTYRCAYNSSSGELMHYTVQLIRTPTTTFEKFRLQIIVGLVASAAALIILGIICGVYNWRWERRHGQDGKNLVHHEEEVQASASDSARHPSYYNEGYSNDKGDITVTSTHV